MPSNEPGGRIVLAATPIGNLADASPRLIESLQTADVIAAEDTRRLHALIDRLGGQTRGRVVSFYEHNEDSRIAELLDAVDAGSDVLIVSDAGMPVISDPGYRLVSEAAKTGRTVTAIPGPSAVLTALAVSGMPTDRFCFEGFLPRKPAERRRTFTALADEQRTMVFYESPHRLAASLRDAAGAFGPARAAAVCRELTKVYEEVRRGPLDELSDWAADGVKGEICLVVHGASSPEPPEPADLVGDVQALAERGVRLKDAAAQIAAANGLRTRELYEAVLKEASSHRAH